MKTGILGNLEVIVMVFDDGDVMAFYTHAIDHAVRQFTDKQTPPPLKP
jgi:hypothetical protein